QSPVKTTPQHLSDDRVNPTCNRLSSCWMSTSSRQRSALRSEFRSVRRQLVRNRVESDVGPRGCQKDWRLTHETRTSGGECNSYSRRGAQSLAQIIGVGPRAVLRLGKGPVLGIYWVKRGLRWDRSRKAFWSWNGARQGGNGEPFPALGVRGWQNIGMCIRATMCTWSNRQTVG